MHCLFFRFGHWFAKCCCQLLCFSFCFLLADVPACKPQSKIWWAHLFWRRNRQKSGMRFLRYPEKTTSNINIRKTDNTALPLSFMISIRTAPKKLLSFIKVLPKEIPPGLIFWIVPRKESGSLSAKLLLRTPLQISTLFRLSICSIPILSVW